MVLDKEAGVKLVDEALKLLFDQHRAEKLSENIAAIAKPDATISIVNEIEKLLVEKTMDSDLPAKDKTFYTPDKKAFNQHLDISYLQPVLIKN